MQGYVDTERQGQIELYLGAGGWDAEGEPLRRGHQPVTRQSAVAVGDQLRFAGQLPEPVGHLRPSRQPDTGWHETTGRFGEDTPLERAKQLVTDLRVSARWRSARTGGAGCSRHRGSVPVRCVRP